MHILPAIELQTLLFLPHATHEHFEIFALLLFSLCPILWIGMDTRLLLFLFLFSSLFYYFFFITSFLFPFPLYFLAVISTPVHIPLAPAVGLHFL